MNTGLAQVRKAKTILLTTFKRDGTPIGTPVTARATLLDGEQAQIAARALARRHPVLHGVLVPATHRVMHYRTLHYELSQPDGAAQGGH